MKKQDQSDPIAILVYIIAIFLFCVVSPVSAARFDCTKAATHVEKLICSNSEISELDDQVNIDYHKALDEANSEQRSKLINQQKHWLKFMRNRCADELCLKHAYWSKLAELKIFFMIDGNGFVVYGPTYKNEAEKSEPIKQILATAKLYEASRNDPLFCRQVFEDLKQMKDISFLEAKVKTTSYEDTALDQWKQYCKTGQSLNFGYECDPKVEPNPKAESDGSCYVIYGEQPFKIFEIPTQEKNKERYILYMGSAFGPMNIKYRGEIRGGDVAGFHELDIVNCKTTKHWNAPIAEPSEYNSIIKYKDDYYFLVLLTHTTSLFIGSIDNEDKSCRWFTKHSNPNSGEK